MNLTMVIPTYWTGGKPGSGAGIPVYDHPTPISGNSTLGRTLASIRNLDNRSFNLVIVVAPTSATVTRQAVARVAEIIKKTDTGVRTFVLGPAELKKVRTTLASAEPDDDFADMLSLKGYSNVRNACLLAARLAGSELCLLIDDDEIFEDQYFINKLNESFAATGARAVAGYYTQPDGGYLIRKRPSVWMDLWGQYTSMNKAFESVIGKPPRFKETPFVFGGNMAIHRDLFTTVPFDPMVPRGEDIDYLINARMFGFSFLLDNELSIKHLPPPRSSPLWRQLRLDMLRFIYEKNKLDNQVPTYGMKRVTPQELDPYPGAFLKGNLMERIEGASRALATQYLEEGDIEASRHSLVNVRLAKTRERRAFNAFDHLVSIQKRWQVLMKAFETTGEPDQILIPI